MSPSTNNAKTDKFSLVSNYEANFVLYMQDDESPLWISNCLEKNSFLKAVFFVIIFQNDEDELVNKLAQTYKSLSFLPKFKHDVLNSLKSEQMALCAASNANQRPEKDNDGKGQDGCHFKPDRNNKDVNDKNKPQKSGKKAGKKKSNSNNNDNVNKGQVLSIESYDEIYDIWTDEGIFIGDGRTAEVFKIPYEGGWVALKMVDVFKHAEDALEELEHEKNFLERILIEYPKG